MLIDDISAATVRDALYAMRYAKPLDASPLLRLQLVAERLAAEGLTDTPDSRAWMVGRVLAELTTEQLALRRGAAVPDEHGPSTPDDAVRALQHDFASGSVERESWGMLYFRFLAEVDHPGRTSILAVDASQSTLHRRMMRGCRALADVLRRLERNAMRRASRRAAGRPAAPAADRAAAPSARARRPRRARQRPSATRPRAGSRVGGRCSRCSRPWPAR